MELVFLGTGATAPTKHRNTSATLLRHEKATLLFDCGEGTLRQLMVGGSLPQITDVFLTHFHADHTLGLPGLLKTYALNQRQVPLRLWGPKGLRKTHAQMHPLIGRLSFEVEIKEFHDNVEITRDGFEIRAFPVSHGCSAVGYTFEEPLRPGRFDPSLARGAGIKPGPDFGRLQRGEVVSGVRPRDVMSNPRPGRRVVFSGDTAPCSSVETEAHRADVLVHEATFLADKSDDARKKHHSTAYDAGSLAARANVKLLALNHIGTRYAARDVLHEVKGTHPNAVVVRDHSRIRLPLPEDGLPEFVL